MKKPVFLFGTLCDPEHFEIVTGTPLEACRAHLEDATVHCVDGESYPVLCFGSGAVADGLLVRPSDKARARMDFYERGFGYSVVERVVQTPGGAIPALIYEPGGALPTGEPWSLSAWQDNHGPLARASAREYMALMATHPPEDAARAFPQIRMRADSRLRAEREPSPAPFSPDLSQRVITPERTEQPYTDYFAVREDWLSFPTFSGAEGPIVKRASYLGGDAVTVLPYDPKTDKVLIIRQFRHGAFVRGDPNPWALEPAAGRIDPGEEPEDTARRELQEETGVIADTLHFVGRYYPSPGAYSEYLYTFVAVADLSNADGGVGGLASEAEDIIRHVVPLDDAIALINTGAANTGPLILSLTWLAMNRLNLT